MTAPSGAGRLVRWRYHFTDFRTGRLLATLPLAGVQLGEVLSGASDASGTLVVSSEQVRRRDPITATVPRRTCLWAERQELDPGTGGIADSRVLWGGVVMKRTRQHSTRSIKIDAVSWASYLARRLVTGRAYAQADKFAIMRGIIAAGARQVPAYDEPPPGSPEQRFPPVLVGTVTQAAWDALYAAGWRERPEVEELPPVTQAAILLAERIRSGGTYAEDFTWPGMPAVVNAYNGALMDATPGVDWRDRPAMIAALEAYANRNRPARRLYHPLAPATPAPVAYRDVTDGTWQALLAAGWKGRPYDQAERLWPPPELATYVLPAVPAPPPVTFGYTTAYPQTPPHLGPLLTLGGSASGILADRTYLASDLKPILEAANELAASGYGFDWRLVPYMEAAGDLSSFRVRLALGYPRLGRTAPADLRWSTDRADARQRWGYVSDLTLTEDGSPVHNRVTALGTGTGPDQIRAVADTIDLPWRNENASGYPLYETSLNSSTNDLRTVDAVAGHARGMLFAQLASEVQVSGIKVRGDLAPTLSMYEVGDDLTVKIGAETGGAPLVIVGQLVSRTIAPNEQGSTEQVALDIQGTAI